jgi:hypothetical protein
MLLTLNDSHPCGLSLNDLQSWLDPSKYKVKQPGFDNPNWLHLASGSIEYRCAGYCHAVWAGGTMAKCANCGTTIAFGGVKEAERRFCGKPCQNIFHLNRASAHLPDGFVWEKAAEIHAGPCPKCGGASPVDFRRSYWVWSAGLVTRWSHKGEVCCKRCGNVAKLKATAFCALLGWWGFPWGLFVTPAQIIRNLGYMVSGPDPSRPSDELLSLTRAQLSAQLLREENTGPAASQDREPA